MICCATCPATITSTDTRPVVLAAHAAGWVETVTAIAGFTDRTEWRCPRCAANRES